jgi:hypothetical protein
MVSLYDDRGSALAVVGHIGIDDEHGPIVGPWRLAFLWRASLIAIEVKIDVVARHVYLIGAACRMPSASYFGVTCHIAFALLAYPAPARAVYSHFGNGVLDTDHNRQNQKRIFLDFVIFFPKIIKQRPPVVVVRR